MNIRLGKKEEKKEAEASEPSFIDERIEKEEAELNLLLTRIADKETEIAKLKKIGDTALYIADILAIINDYKKKGHTDVKVMLKDMENELIELAETVED